MFKPFPCLSLCMIVKNEEKNLSASLDSIKPIADEIIIVDTGSKDKTLEIAKKYADLLIQIPWDDDFSKARNISLEEATGEWILVMDADEIFCQEDMEALKEIILQKQEYEGFFIKVINRKKQIFGEEEESFSALRLFKNRKTYRFSGAIHEQIGYSIPSEKLAFTSIRIIHQGHHNPAKNKERSKRNIRILEKELTNEPDHPFHRFNLGVEYMALHQFKKAIEQLEAIQLSETDRLMWISRYFKTLAYCYIKEERWDAAQRIIQKGIHQFPDFPDLYFLEAMRLTALHRYQEALSPLYQCLNIGEAKNPEYISEKGMGTYKALYMMGRIYEQLGETKKAKIYYFNTLEWNPAHVSAGGRLMELLMHDQKPIEVWKYLHLLYEQNNPKHLLIMAKIFFEAGEYKLCQRFAKKALKNGAENDPAYYLLGLSSYMEGKWRKMGRYFAQIKEFETFQFTHLNLILYSLKEIVKKINETQKHFPDSLFFMREEKKLLSIIQQYGTDEWE